MPKKTEPQPITNEATTVASDLHAIFSAHMGVPVCPDSDVADFLARYEPGKTAKELHDARAEALRADGWEYDPIYDPAEKKSPHILPFENLCPHQRLYLETLAYALK